MDLVLDIGGAAPASHRHGAGALVAFMSFALARGFGGQHPLIALADLAHDIHRVPLGPLTTFYEAGPEDSEDEQKLELAWQPVGPLRAAIDALLRVVGDDPTATALVTRAGACSLHAELQWLHDQLLGLDPGTPVRLSYTL